MKTYKAHSQSLSGSNYAEIRKKANRIFHQLKSKTKRKPYIRSSYFKKEKIFLDLFWSHLYEKNYWDQIRRMKFFPCAIELIQKSRFEPISKENPNNTSEILHRFAGISSESELFFVQIKENKASSKKSLISVFPLGK